ncbi:unnamed protein product, partial [Timema podura]|nr:unnamed protein product [Timema podura]
MCQLSRRLKIYPYLSGQIIMMIGVSDCKILWRPLKKATRSRSLEQERYMQSRRGSKTLPQHI